MNKKEEPDLAALAQSDILEAAAEGDWPSLFGLLELWLSEHDKPREEIRAALQEGAVELLKKGWIELWLFENQEKSGSALGVVEAVKAVKDPENWKEHAPADTHFRIGPTAEGSGQYTDRGAL